ncbi:MAG: M13 family metallopeptidase [Planctomycetota bacterium]
MNRFTKLCIPLAFTGLIACAAAPDPIPSNTHPAPNDSELQPGEDFYLYTNQAWKTANPIPAAKSSWSVAHEINESNKALLHQIMIDAGAASNSSDHITSQLGKLWNSGMDTEAIEKAGLDSIRWYLNRIDSIEDAQTLAQVVAELHLINVDVLFGLGADADFENSSQTITFLSPGGLGLPEKDYYFREDDDSVALRMQYVAHIGNMLQLAGATEEDAKAAAERVFTLELKLAEKSLAALDYRDPQVLSNKISSMTLGTEITPNFDWSTYSASMGLEQQPMVNLIGPDFFSRLNSLLVEVDLATWREYLRWHLITRSAPFLNQALVEEDFDFYSRKLSGTEQNQTRWERVLGSANGAMGDALGQAFVKVAFSPEAKSAALTMVNDLLAAFRVRLGSLEWMTEETKARAVEKLDSFTVKIGYPDVWRDYTSLEMNQGSWIGNMFAASNFNNRFELAKIGKPVDKAEWGMSPQTVNAYYNPLANEIVFPAAILQPPFFSLDQSLAENYGSMGAIIGHEITHGFDDMGSQFDADGNLSNWWTAADREEFDRRTAILVKQFDAYVAVDDLHVNGSLTLGENIADLGGVQMAYLAFKTRESLNSVKGNSDQDFFTAYVRSWRGNTRPAAMKLQINTDPHAPGHFRANGPLGNFPAFAEAFHLDASAPMVRAASDRAEIW